MSPLLSAGKWTTVALWPEQTTVSGPQGGVNRGTVVRAPGTANVPRLFGIPFQVGLHFRVQRSLCDRLLQVLNQLAATKHVPWVLAPPSNSSNSLSLTCAGCFAISRPPCGLFFGYRGFVSQGNTSSGACVRAAAEMQTATTS